MNYAVQMIRKILDYFDLVEPPDIRVLAVPIDEQNYKRLDEGQWVSGRFDRNIRLDRATHLRQGDLHAHVFGRHKNLVVVVRTDGTASHGKKGRLHQDDADALRVLGFTIRADNIVEWWEIESIGFQILLG